MIRKMRIKHMKRAAAVTGLALCGTLALGGFAQANAATATTSGTSVSQQGGHQLVVKGVVTGLGTAVHNGQQVQVVQVSAGKHTVKWAVTKKTQVTEHGKPVPASAIKVGDEVTAQGSVPSSSLPPQGAIIAASKIAIQ
jgi:hypothetical protein